MRLCGANRACVRATAPASGLCAPSSGDSFMLILRSSMSFVSRYLHMRPLCGARGSRLPKASVMSSGQTISASHRSGPAPSRLKIGTTVGHELSEMIV